MSVQNDLIEFKRTREALNKKLAEISSKLDTLYAKKEPLVKKAEALSVRTSSLAQSLLKEIQEELERVNKAIAQVEKEQAEVVKEMDDVQHNIFIREDEVELYVSEQTSIMILDFLEYIRNHMEELGLEIKKTFSVIQVSQFRDDRYNGCYIPTGNIGIYDESNKTFIASSKDFYFKKELYSLSRDTYDSLICTVTGWYEGYRDYFISYFLEALKKRYTYGNYFKLTIESPYITLELV